MYTEGLPEKLIMERSGHLSLGGVPSYELTSEGQASRILTSSNTAVSKEIDTRVTSKALEKILPGPLDDDKENKMIRLLNLQGCTLNFNIH